jgi:hypothetical protein
MWAAGVAEGALGLGQALDKRYCRQALFYTDDWDANKRNKI